MGEGTGIRTGDLWLTELDWSVVHLTEPVSAIKIN